MARPHWRIVVVSTVAPVVRFLLPALRDLGHDPAAVVAARSRPRETLGETDPGPGSLVELAPSGVDVLFAAAKERVEPLLRLYAPDLVLCWGFPWKLPPAALAVPRLGSVNLHPALLPRHRGPIPLAWALRAGDDRFGITWHRMDAELDTGPILAQTTVPIEDGDVTIDQIGPRIRAAALGMLPGVLGRVAAGDPGDPQPEEGASWAAHFGEDYVELDWGRSARELHDQVRAWALTFGLAPVRGPLGTVAGERVRVLRTSLVEQPGAERVETGDGPLWIVAREPA